LVGTQVRKIVLDVLKPRQPSIQDMASKLASLHGVDNVGVSVVEMDESTESVKVSIEGSDITIENVRKMMERLGAVIHSIDEVLVSKKLKTV
jgi:hypothetical protein